MELLSSLHIEHVPGGHVPRELLLAADESPLAVADYIGRGRCYGAFLSGRMVGEYVLLHTLLRHAVAEARAAGFRKLEIGTGNSGFGQMALYTRCGFRMEWIDRDFFALHYPEPIVEEGIPCRDMVRMGMLL